MTEIEGIRPPSKEAGLTEAELLDILTLQTADVFHIPGDAANMRIHRSAFREAAKVIIDHLSQPQAGTEYLRGFNACREMAVKACINLQNESLAGKRRMLDGIDGLEAAWQSIRSLQPGKEQP